MMAVTGLSCLNLRHIMAIREINRYHFPWRGGNRFRLHVDGDDFFPAMLEAIDQAEHFITLEMYLVKSGALLDRFIDALLGAAQREVKILLLLDDFGARDMNMDDRQRLQHANVRLEFYNPTRYGELRRSLFRDHRKLLLVDNRIAFIGGAGLTDAFDPTLAGEHFWHDIMVEINGPCVDDWCRLFVDNWPADKSDLDFFGQITSPRPEANPSQLGRVTITQMLSRQEIKASLIKRLNNAEHWVYLTTAYFVPSLKIRRTLRKAARRGVDVRLILPGRHTDHPAIRHAGRRFYYSLLKHGVRIFEYQPRFSHTKAYLCDQWCSIGSSNLDRWNLLWNLEGNQEIDDQRFAETLKQMFANDLEDCKELHYESWRLRPRYRRLLEWFWGRIDIWLHRLALRWHKDRH